MKKKRCYKNHGQILTRNLITQLFVWALTRILILTAGYTKSYYLKKSLKAVNNTPAPEIWRLLTCQNCQMICKPYCWDKQHTNMSPNERLINGYALLLENDVSTSAFNAHTSILSARNHFCVIFLNSHKYFQDIFLGHIRDVRE